jgi:hypothetical protein
VTVTRAVFAESEHHPSQTTVHGDGARAQYRKSSGKGLNSNLSPDAIAVKRHKSDICSKFGCSSPKASVTAWAKTDAAATRFESLMRMLR